MHPKRKEMMATSIQRMICRLVFSFHHHSPDNYKVPALMRGHAIEDILKHLCLFVQCLTHFPLQQVYVPQVALSQHTVQHYRRWCFHLHRHSPASQRVPISHLDGTQTKTIMLTCGSESKIQA